MDIVNKYVKAGSLIYSDKMASYVNSRNNTSHFNENYSHLWTNHKLYFVDPTDNTIHTNNIERIWRSLRASISQIRRSVSTEDVGKELAIFNFRYNHENAKLYELFLNYSIIYLIDRENS